MTSEKINQKEYLKKYFFKDDKSKKKKKSKIGQQTVKIIDDDVDLQKIRPIEDDEFEILNATEDAPQIVGVLDERGHADFSDKNKWKIIADDGMGNISIKEQRTSRRGEGEDKKDPVKGKLKESNKSQKESNKNIVKNFENSNQVKSKFHKQNNSLRKERESSNSDLSIPRKSPSPCFSENDSHRKRNYKVGKKKKKIKESEADLSSLKTKKSKFSTHKVCSNSDTDSSPPRNKSKHSENYDSDLSPPRNKSKHSESSDADLSPPRNKSKHGENYDSDLSPPRKSGDRKRRNQYKNYDSDLSPPRKSEERKRSQYKNCDSDLSSPRKNRRDSSAKGDLRKSRKDSHKDFSPPRIYRKSRDLDRFKRSRKDVKDDGSTRSDECSFQREIDHRRDFESDSQERKSGKKSEKSRYTRESRWNRESKSRSPEVSKDKRMKRTLDGKKAGLQDATNLREETAAHNKREAEIFEKLSAEVSGEGQLVTIRDRKTGRRRDLQAEAAVEREKRERQREVNKQYEKWGKGLKQQADIEEKLKDDRHEMSKPLARYKDDVDLQNLQKNTLRESDPMLQFGREKLVKQGLISSECQHLAPLNRFGIKPGKHWDGVDRSNGYERKWFETQSAKKATQEEAYKYSSSDM